MKKSLSERTLEYLRRQACWICSADLERLALQAGYKSSNVGRRCREMVSGKLSDGRICPITLERKEVNGVVWYKAIGPIKIVQKFVVINGQRELFKTERIY